MQVYLLEGFQMFDLNTVKRTQVDTAEQSDGKIKKKFLTFTDNVKY